MTYDEQLQYYADLLIVQYRNKVAAQANVQALGREALIDNLPLTVQDAFGLDTAIGAQLDIIGKYAGVVRSVLTLTGGIVLSDDDFRTLIKLALLINNGTGTLAEIDNLLFNFLNGALVAFDNADMTMGYFMNARLGSQQLAEAIVALGLLPKPMGVELASLIYAGGLGFFGYRTYEHATPNNFGYRTYEDYIVLQTTGDATSGSPIVTNLASTAGLVVGMQAVGVSFTPTNAATTRPLIKSIDSSTQITLTENATASHTGTSIIFVNFEPWLGYGDTITIPT